MLHSVRSVPVLKKGPTEPNVIVEKMGKNAPVWKFCAGTVFKVTF